MPYALETKTALEIAQSCKLQARLLHLKAARLEAVARELTSEKID